MKKRKISEIIEENKPKNLQTRLDELEDQKKDIRKYQADTETKHFFRGKRNYLKMIEKEEDRI